MHVNRSGETNKRNEKFRLAWKCFTFLMFPVMHDGSVQKVCGGARSNGKRTFTKTSEAEWACATRGSRGWSRGVHTWSVRVDDVAHGVSLGISRKDIDKTDADANIAKRYDLYCGQGRVVDTDDNDYSCFSQPISNGSVVSVRLDMGTPRRSRLDLTVCGNGNHPLKFPLESGILTLRSSGKGAKCHLLNKRSTRNGFEALDVVYIDNCETDCLFVTKACNPLGAGV